MIAKAAGVSLNLHTPEIITRRLAAYNTAQRARGFTAASLNQHERIISTASADWETFHRCAAEDIRALLADLASIRGTLGQLAAAGREADEHGTKLDGRWVAEIAERGLEKR